MTGSGRGNPKIFGLNPPFEISKSATGYEGSQPTFKLVNVLTEVQPFIILYFHSMAEGSGPPPTERKIWQKAYDAADASVTWFKSKGKHVLYVA